MCEEKIVVMSQCKLDLFKTSKLFFKIVNLFNKFNMLSLARFNVYLLSEKIYKIIIIYKEK